MYFAIVDVEGTDKQGVYDFGAVIVDKDFNPVRSFNYVVADVFFDYDEMRTAYYADKMPQYRADIAAGIRKVATLEDVAAEFNATLAEFGISKVWAFNARYDSVALNKTLGRDFLTSANWACIWNYAANVICNSKNYFDWCEECDRLTKSGYVSTGAESVYSYLTRTPEFDEEHTGYADALIEAEILKACRKRKRKEVSRLSSVAWRAPQDKYLLRYL